ncbi:hypothetical protein DEO72_LG9g1855 [Vigna unguiculata]|uniref:Uncharacterized protein n=1 Tax=Vigna unguiculata TaxID=3917 RepID=A0A4D6N1W6_VIGUN|nr:hypothetical protein DEO72_LG9g1855 [Vigna unguiculata]
MATTMLIVFYVFNEYLKMSCYHTYRPQPIEHVWKTMLRITHRNVRAIYLDPSVLAITSTHTGNTRQPELNSRVPCVHPPSRAQLEGCHSKPQLKQCHVLNLYPELNSRDKFRATTQGTPANRPLRYHRSLVDHAHHSKHNTNLQQQNPLALLMRRQALPTSRLPGRGHCSSPQDSFNPIETCP